MGFKSSPSGQSCTTRAPVKTCFAHAQNPSFEVRFQGVKHYPTSLADVAPTVQNIMSQIPAGDIDPNEVTVKIKGPGLPPLTCTDLPGICDDSVSRELVVSFLRENPDTIPICLVDANSSSLAAHAAIDLVRQHANMRPWLVLTKCDKLLRQVPWDIQQQLLNRLLGSSGDVTATHWESVHAVSCAAAEQSCHSSRHATETEQIQRCIVQDPGVMSAAFQPHSNFLQQHCGMEELIKALVAYIQQIMCRRALPSLLCWLQHHLQEAQQTVDDLGPERVDVQEAMRELVSTFDLQQAINSLIRPETNDPQICLDLGDGKQVPATHFRPRQVHRPNIGFFQQQKDLSEAIRAGILRFLADQPYMPLLKGLVEAACAKQGPLRVDRFPALKAAILDHGLAHAINAEQVKAHICSMPCIQQLQCQRPNFTKPGVLPGIVAAVREELVVEFVVALPDRLLAQCVDWNLVLEESRSHQEKRQHASMILRELQQAWSTSLTFQAAHPAPAPAPASAAQPSQVPGLGCLHGTPAGLPLLTDAWLHTMMQTDSAKLAHAHFSLSQWSSG